MDFSTANQTMVSRAYYDVISRISDGADELFEFLGERYDKHQRAHEVYRLLDQRGARLSPASDGATPAAGRRAAHRGRGGAGHRDRADPGHRPRRWFPRAEDRSPQDLLWLRTSSWARSCSSVT